MWTRCVVRSCWYDVNVQPLMLLSTSSCAIVDTMLWRLPIRCMASLMRMSSLHTLLASFAPSLLLASAVSVEKRQLSTSMCSLLTVCVHCR